MTKCLVTGANSFIGRAVCEELLSRGEETYALVRTDSIDNLGLAKLSGLKVLEGDMETIATCLAATGGIENVIHLAWEGRGSVGRADRGVQDRNLRNSMNLLRVVSDFGCKVFVGGGSQAEYGKSQALISEGHECNPVSEYGKAKLRFTLGGAETCERLGMRYRMPRIFSVFGPGDHPWTLMSTLVRALELGQVLALTSCDQHWNYLYVSDVARALIALLDEQHADGIYNVGSEVTKPLKEFVIAVCERYPNSPRPDFGAIAPHPDGAASLRPSVTKLRRQIGWTEDYTFEAGLSDMIQRRGQRHKV